MADKVAAAVAAMALAVTLFAAGFGACTLPASTQILAQATANDAESPYADGQLTALAVETRGFTVDDYGRGADGEDGARDRIAAAILDAAREASAEGSPVRGRWSAEARKAVAADADGSSPQAALDRLAAVDDAYALDGDALSHLDDCNVLVRTAVPLLWGVAALTAAALAYLLVRRERRLAGTALVVAPAVLIAAFAALGAWAALDFNGLFAAFHSLFFVDGTWTFNYDSLLISMYPIDFWMGMGAVWVGSAIGVGLLCFAAGCLFAWKAQVQHRELEEAAAADAARSKKRKKGRK